MIRGVRAAKRVPSWQDLRAVYPLTVICRAFRIHGAHILPKPARFGCMARESCRELVIFPSEVTFGIHGAQNLPRIAARERAAAKSCHGLPSGNAPRENLVTVERRGNAFHGHFAIGERPQCRSVMCRSATDARAERPAHALRARRSCPRSARHSTTMPCAVRGALPPLKK